jgi:signal transduction histidine kinase/CheY-like chemotaxis protein
MKNKRWHILLIDDNPDDRADLRQMLLCGVDRRYRFTEVELGAEGVRKILGHPGDHYDCVLLDYHLPDMNAEEVLAAVCMGLNLPPCPILVVTGSGREEGLNLIRAGAQDYIGKNWITSDSLIRAVENAIERFALLAERAKIEDTLRIERERLALALTSGQMGIYDWNLASDKLWWSPELYTVFGVTPDNFMPTRDAFSSLIHPDDRDVFWQQMGVSIAQCQPFRFAFRSVCPAGDLRWISVRGQTEYDAGNRSLRHFGVVLDTTERKRIEIEKQIIDQRARIALDAGRLGDWSWDAALDQVTMSPLAAQIYGFPVGVVVTRAQMREHLSPEEADYACKSWDEALINHTDYNNDYRVNRPGKTACWVAMTGRGSYTEEGVLIGMNGVIQDITERKRVELELIEAKLVADKANLAKSEFLSSMSHELRTPLNAILGFAQLLESGTPPPTPSQKLRLDEIIKAGWYLLELINEILDLALIESGKVTLLIESLALVDVLLECMAMIEPQAQQHGIKLILHPIDNSWLAKADRTRVKQVLLNLLSNAIKYNSKQGTIEVACTLNTAGRIRISIKDEGAGLSPEQVAQLFQSFNRLGQEAGIEEGTGIGLVVSKHLVELMGGRIGVESTVGVGSEFWIELMKDSALHSVANAKMANMPKPVLQNNPVLSAVLYIEDNLTNIMLVEHIISDLTYLRLLSAFDGKQGIALACSQLPSIILMDITLPDMRGIDLLKTLQLDPRTAHIPIIALSGNTLANDVQLGLEAGFFRYLTKPIKVQELINALNDALAVSKTHYTRSKREQQT